MESCREEVFCPRSLIRKNLRISQESWEWLKGKLLLGLYAKEEEFVSVSAQDVLQRNRKKVSK